MSTILFQKKFDQGVFTTYAQRPEQQHLSLHQVHGIEILTPPLIGPECQADGLEASYLDLKQTDLAIKTADCLPVLFLGDYRLSLVHAGWRGLAHGILKHPKISTLNPHTVFIGPCIHACCFEVSEEFKNEFPHSNHFTHRKDKLYFDLVAEAKDQLKGINVEDSGLCTYCTPNQASFRRDKNQVRNWNVFSLKVQ